MVEWWYGHNAVGFFLTAGFLGMMYYFVPKQAGRPIYSYRLSVVHFWALISVYMWAGPHHLHYTSLPDWAQSLGMVFSLMLLAPSWGGMINGIMTLSGAWHKLRTDPILKFMIVSLSFYGMSTFEGPMMSIKTVNALSHYTDWTIGHVHSGALGWVAMMTIGSLYCLIPRLYGRTQMCSTRLIDWHFWTSTIGVVLYIAAMWIAGVMQGLMWRATNPDGTLTYTLRRSAQGDLSLLPRAAASAALLVLGRHVHDGLQRLDDRARSSAARRSSSRVMPRRHDARAEEHAQHETRHHRKERRSAGGADRLVISVGGLVEIVPLYLSGQVTKPAPRRQAPRARWQLDGPRHLRARGLLPLPLADDPPVARRDRALRSLLGRRRIAVRPSVPVRLQAHRARTSRASAAATATTGTACTCSNPRDVVPESNMPGFPWLARNTIDAS